MLQKFIRSKSKERQVEAIFLNSNGMKGKEGNGTMRRDKNQEYHLERVTLRLLRENKVEKRVVETEGKVA